MTLGMSRDAVHDYMGTETLTVCNGRPLAITSRDRELGDTYVTFRSAYTVVPNPYKTEELMHDGSSFTVDYYVTGFLDTQKDVSDDLLTPLLYWNEILVGWGWEYLEKLRKESRV